MSATDLDQQLVELKRQADEAHIERVREEARVEQLLARRDELLARLKTEFGCETLAQAKEKIDSATAEHAAELAKIQQALKEATA